MKKQEDCRKRTSLGPKALEWLRTNVPSFRVMEAEAKRLLAEKAANAKENGR